MAIRGGQSVLNEFPAKNVEVPSGMGAVPGGNSGSVISPAPKLGLSSYQEPKLINKSSKSGE